MSEDVGGQWDCDYCEKKKLRHTRNCQGNGQEFRLIIYGHEIRQCPLPFSMGNEEEIEVINTVLFCEGGEFGGGWISPQILLKETAFYFNVRGIALSERRRIMKIKEEKRKRHAR